MHKLVLACLPDISPLHDTNTLWKLLDVFFVHVVVSPLKVCLRVKIEIYP